MSACNSQMMTNHHHSDLSYPLAAISDAFHIWRRRYRTRRELAHLSERDLHDVGLSWAELAHEANKPFWRA